MQLATGAAVFGAFIAVYFFLLLLESRRRGSRMINDHPFRSAYDPARGAARQRAADASEGIRSARGTR